ncbi:MAG: alpha amylase C-terminal domain-containing protein [Salinivirgaceae bacterium]
MVKPKYLDADKWLEPFEDTILKRQNYISAKKIELTGNKTLNEFASGYLYFGIHSNDTHIIIREYAPNAVNMFLLCDLNRWEADENYRFIRLNNNVFELIIDKILLPHQSLYKLFIEWDGGSGQRIPSYARRVVQDENTKIFAAQIWQPDHPYKWQVEHFARSFEHPLIYEAHIGMAQDEEKVGTYTEFKNKILPRIAKAGYNTIQLMAIQEHPYYGSFGYHRANYYAPTSRFGTPDELKALIDKAQQMGLVVIVDIVHSHAVKNTEEGLGLFDGDPGLYFHNDHRREHAAWDSLCFDYGKNHVLHFLLSNCKYWLDEFKFDGFRFDGVTSMLYYDHGLGQNFTSYDQYFNDNQDIDAITYLTLANQLIHENNSQAISIAEEMSGFPGLCGKHDEGGVGFDYRMAMGMPDYWIKTIKEKVDENWDMGELFHELTSHRPEESVISYSESHDQALVGDKTLFFRLVDKDIYHFMSKETQSLVIDRGIALHKMIRLITLSTTHGGYLNFMGNEFGHPEWIDFPREGNQWSFNYCKRQWHLADDKKLKYHYLSDFDEAMIKLFNTHKTLNVQNIDSEEINNEAKVIAFQRGELLFIFNFHPTASYPDYGIYCSGANYKLLLSSDSSEFGGFDRIEDKLYPAPMVHHDGTSSFQLKIYLPARTAIVLSICQ